MYRCTRQSDEVGETVMLSGCQEREACWTPRDAFRANAKTWDEIDGMGIRGD